MTKQTVRTRFAPSPTGYMHIGNLRTALYGYLYAKSQQGQFILRIEDTDRTRYVADAVDFINRTLEMAHIVPDESPSLGGPYGPYVQSERMDLYKKYAEELVKTGHAYYCFCDPDEDHSAGKFGGYDRTCRNLAPEVIEEHLKNGDPYVIRQKMPLTGETTFFDVLHGNITIKNEELEDQVLLKRDGMPTYNFANVIDDHLMGVTHVVRGNEYLSSSPKYNRIYEAFGWEVPVYVHCPLITNEEHQKLSKRCGHSSYEDLIDQGFLKDAIVNFVALLGWSPEGNREIYSLEELVKIFDYHHISKSPAVFDMTKLRWMNGEYMKAMDDEKFYEMALPYIQKTIHRPLDFKKIAAMVKTRIEVFPDIADLIDFFEEVPEYDASMYTHKKMKTNEETSLALLQEVKPLLAAQEDFSNDALFEMLSAFGKEKGYKTGYIMWPIRTALSGKQMTPAGATEILEVLEKEESLARIDKAIEKLSK